MSTVRSSSFRSTAPLLRIRPPPPSSASVPCRSPLPVSTLAASVTLVKSRMNRRRISGHRGRMLSDMLLFAEVERDQEGDVKRHKISGMLTFPISAILCPSFPSFPGGVNRVPSTV
ncbi:hypothetical protein Hanom_Chr00s017865g01757491 [Helianthus anomalus]